MGKMYYTEEEAAEKLGVSEEELANYVRDSKLRVFQDGQRKMFRVDEVDGLAGGGEDEVELAPAGESDSVSLSEADTAEAAPPTKEDTVITAEGISIFDDEDLEIEADPMAKTQIAPSIEDQISLEGVGSGSGLLDLTRESDDTSLGAEVLDTIDIDEEGGEEPAEAPPAASGTAPAMAPAQAPAPEAAPQYVEAIDASSGLFGGVVIGCAIVAALLGAVALSTFAPNVPDYIVQLKANLTIVVIAALLVMIVAAVLGWLVGKSAASRQRAMKQMGA